MPNSISANVLIIGKSGVGKSSLLNYIFEKTVEETGTGKPVTKKGIFSHNYIISDDFYINLYDTWGLEADKTMEWETLIKDEVAKHDCGEIADWFHAILYCFSAKASRIEEFEIQIIKKLISNGNRVIILLTHSDVNNVENSIPIMREKLIAETGIEGSNIINTCSVSKKLLSGKVTETCGRDEILSKIRKNLWNSICIKIPMELLHYSEDQLYQSHKNCCFLVDSKIKFYNTHSIKVFNSINSFCDFENKLLFEGINKKYTDLCSDAFTYYNELGGKLYPSTQRDVKATYINKFEKMNFHMDFGDKFAENIAYIIAFAIPIIGFFIPSVAKDSKQDEIKKQIGNCRDRNKEIINKIVEDIQVKFDCMIV